MTFKKPRKVSFPWLAPLLPALPVLAAGAYALIRLMPKVISLIDIALKMVVTK